MIDKQKVQDVLDTVRPMLQADGGDVKLINVRDDGTVEVELEGACKGCPMSQMTLAGSVERILQSEIPGVTRVVPTSF
ncbi:MAG: NifU family protein [Actinomycetia bacterium]|nr:NifU family protein [Actinomycetes bacterium]